MKPNLWIYSNQRTISHTADSLTAFGAGIFRKAKIIKDLDLLEEIVKGLDNQSSPPNINELNEFFFSYLMDAISILIFFENYMKAQLIRKENCVHQLKKDIPEFKDIAKRQFFEPISIDEINSIEPFEIYAEKEEIFHRGIKETTIGMKELIGSQSYLNNYPMSDEILNFVKELTSFRNKLHFNHVIDFSISMEKINTLKNVKAFVDETVQNILANNMNN